MPKEQCNCNKYPMCLTLLLDTVNNETGVGNISRIKFGDKGHYPSILKGDAEYVKQQNIKLGISPNACKAMEMCSMTGTWSSFQHTLDIIKSHSKENNNA